MLEELDLAIVDVETTGASASDSRVIEIGIQRIEGGQLVDTYSSLVDPGCEIPEFIEQLTGIRNEDVEGAPSFESIHHTVRALTQDCVFVAHNAGFDYSFLRSEFERLDEVFLMPSLCTVQFSRRLFPEHRRHNLSILIERYDLSCENRHRALDDAGVVWAFLQHARTLVEPKKYNEAIRELIRIPSELRVEKAAGTTHG